jgi:hypothetical protein
MWPRATATDFGASPVLTTAFPGQTFSGGREKSLCSGLAPRPPGWTLTPCVRCPSLNVLAAETRTRAGGRRRGKNPGQYRGLTGPLVAVFNQADNDHAKCAEFLRENWSRLVLPSLAVTEVCHLLADPRRRGSPGLAAEFCAAIADDELRVIEVTPHDYRRMANRLPVRSQKQAGQAACKPRQGTALSYPSAMAYLTAFRCEKRVSTRLAGCLV